MTKPAPANAETWRQLLRPALRIVDSLASTYGKLDFRLGGGTVLMLRFNHRISKDIDLFTHDAQALGYLSPRLNDAAGRESTDYLEQANTLKILLPAGDIDFIVAAPVIPGAKPETLEFEGRNIATDATSEILAKKLAYRADDFKPRDVFDMATALALDRPSAIAALKATWRTRPALSARLKHLDGSAAMTDPRDLVLTDAGRSHFPDMVGALRRAVADADRLGVGPAVQRATRRVGKSGPGIDR